MSDLPPPLAHAPRHAGLPLLPSRRAVQGLALLFVLAAMALMLGAPHASVAWVAAVLLGTGLALAAADAWLTLRDWRAAPVQATRRLPHALALGVPKVLTLSLAHAGPRHWRGAAFDDVDPTLACEGLPQAMDLPPGRSLELRYTVTPGRRGAVHFGATELRLRSRLGCFELRRFVGASQSLQVYPNFAAVAGYAWLAGDRRLAQIGIKTYAQRGAGTDFKQLADYQRGDAIRHIDWRATLKHRRPIVRQYQDERDQCVLFLLDCGRRMRADEGSVQAGGSHFDQALNALMLLSYVALKEGDEVGALTFGLPEGEQRHFAPRKGQATLNALMARLHDVEPGTGHADYLQAARHLLRLQHKRALVIVLTNFRDEDAQELQPALELLRRRHLVLLANLRERVLRELAEQPLVAAPRGDGRPAPAVEIAGAHLFEQARREAFARASNHDPLAIDVEPQQLAVALVNRYHAVKRSGRL